MLDQKEPSEQQQMVQDQIKLIENDKIKKQKEKAAAIEIKQELKVAKEAALKKEAEAEAKKKAEKEAEEAKKKQETIEKQKKMLAQKLQNSALAKH